MLTKEFFSDANIGIAHLAIGGREGLFPFVRFFEIFAIEGTGERNFPLGSAADCADIASHCRTETAGPAFLADLTKKRLRHSL